MFKLKTKWHLFKPSIINQCIIKENPNPKYKNFRFYKYNNNINKDKTVIQTMTFIYLQLWIQYMSMLSHQLHFVCSFKSIFTFQTTTISNFFEDFPWRWDDFQVKLHFISRSCWAKKKCVQAVCPIISQEKYNLWPPSAVQDFCYCI